MLYCGKNVLAPDDLRNAIFQEAFSFTEEKISDQKEISADIDPFVCEEVHRFDATVPLNDICGTAHPSYSGRTWGYILEGAKKIDRNLEQAINNPDYYIKHTVASSDAISYIKIRDKYYIEAGNHRSTIAKFLLPAFGMSEINNVTVCEFKIDEVLKELVYRLEQAIEGRGLISWSVVISNQTKKKEDWVSDKYMQIIPHNVSIQIVSRDKPIVFSNPCLDETKKEIELLIEAINMKSFFARISSKNPYLKYLK